jgi:hypothetical protein
VDTSKQAIDYALKVVEVGSFTVKRAMDEITVHRNAQTKAAALRPDLLTYMVENGVVNEDMKQAADAMLGSHAESLQLLKAAVDKIVELKKFNGSKQAADLGAGQNPQSTGVAKGAAAEGDYDSLSDPVVGRRTNEKKASDYALAKGAL